MIGALTALIFTNFFLRDVIGQYEVVNHTKSTQLNPSITELITITKYHSFEGKLGVSRMDGLLTLEIFGDICSRCVCFFGNCNGYD